MIGKGTFGRSATGSIPDESVSAAHFNTSHNQGFS